MTPKPLHQVTEKKNPFRWTKQCEKAFTQLKSSLTSAPIFALPDWTRPFILDTDASETSIWEHSYPSTTQMGLNMSLHT